MAQEQDSLLETLTMPLYSVIGEPKGSRYYATTTVRAANAAEAKKLGRAKLEKIKGVRVTNIEVTIKGGMSPDEAAYKGFKGYPADRIRFVDFQEGRWVQLRVYKWISPGERPIAKQTAWDMLLEHHWEDRRWKVVSVTDTGKRHPRSNSMLYAVNLTGHPKAVAGIKEYEAVHGPKP